MMRLCMIAAVMTGSLFATTNASFAHGGTLDRSGCHFDTRTKVYHCHQGPFRTDNSATDEQATKSRLKQKRK